MRKFAVFSGLLGMAMLFAPSSAFAACADPTGNAGSQVYNETYNVMQYCNGTNWIVMGSDAAGANLWQTNGVTNDIYFTGGNVGIGTNAPATALHVMGIITAGGAIRLANNSVVLSCAAAGDIRYNSTDKAIEVCDGTAWLAAGIAKFNTVGSVPYVGADKKLTESANLKWDDAAAELTVGKGVMFVSVPGNPPKGAGTSALVLADITDVNTSSAVDGDVITYNGNAWASEAIPDKTLNDLTDVTISGVAEGQVLAYSGGAWSNQNLLLDTLGDVIISGVATNDTLTYNGSNWVNSPLSWLKNGTSVYYNGGNVGIGTNTPASKLDVEGGIAVGSTYSGTTAAPTNGAIIEGNVGIGTLSPTTGAKLDVNGQIVGGGTSQIWNAIRTGQLYNPTAWTTIPGLSITFTLTRNATVMVTSSLVQYAGSGYIHVGYRLVVDGTGRGDPTWGETIQMSSISSNIWWDMPSFSRAISLTAGSHTISTQATISTGALTGNASICGTSGYSTCEMQIVAYYQ